MPGPAFFADAWRYIRVDNQRGKWGDFDEPDWLRYFGLAVGDLNGDGRRDIVSGRYYYRNPGGDLSSGWERVDLGRNIDAFLVTDVDGDARGDLIAQALPAVYWVEAVDPPGDAWVARKVAELPPTGHVNSQGFALGQLVPGGRPEIVVASGEGIYVIEIPPDPVVASWPATLVTGDASDEGVAVADIDGDGLEDLVGSQGAAVLWWPNPGRLDGAWIGQRIGEIAPYDADRIAAADIDGDGRSDVVVTQELVGEDAPKASLYWFRQPEDASSQAWPRQRLVTGYSFNSLDAGDIDGDGDIDLVTAEHKGPQPRLLLLENEGGGRFLVREIDRGKESHLGARLADLDDDGDPDLVSIAWDRYQDLHLWRNDRTTTPPPLCWRRRSNQRGDFAKAGVGQQSSAVVLDIDKDGRDDFVIAGWDPQTSMVWFRSTEAGLVRYLVDDCQSHIDAGGVAFDIDGDGDLDVVQGGSWNTNRVWWWENPHPDHRPAERWSRHSIKDWGLNQHHDQAIGDFDGDGSAELAFWNQQAQTLFLADVPDAPRDPWAWDPVPIWSWRAGSCCEGLVRADIDRDGKDDLVGGGRWFRHLRDKIFAEEAVDPGYGFSRSAAGDLIEGGRLEILLASGDGVGPLNLYEWRDGAWNRTTLIAHLDHGHTLEIGDLNGDRHLDIYTAEVHTPGAGATCRQLVLHGDGRGGFEARVLSTGIGTHEGRLGDLDGDGDLDILQKDFQHERRIELWLNEGAVSCFDGSLPPVAPLLPPASP
ncbi:MAG: FG-GAP repeat domain-containing protein [Bdellovibrio bacteriovorus]